VFLGVSLVGLLLSAGATAVTGIDSDPAAIVQGP
jgi:hypothetical protein